MTTSTRVPYWDNARFMAVTLVVIGHGLQKLTSSSDTALIGYLVIYGFHMPVFAIISGYFSKGGPPDARQLKRVITDILVPYVIFEAIWSFIQFLVSGTASFNPTTASWTLWFLLALAIFRLVLPYLALLRFPLLWAVVFSVAVGYFPNVDNTFSLSRAIGILPFFVLGWKLREWGIAERWLALSGRAVLGVRVAGAAVLGAWVVTVIVLIDPLRAIHVQNWFFYNDSYAVIADSAWWAGAARLGFMALATLLCAAFLVIVPRSQTWISDLGQATMYVYLLHTFVLYPVRESGVLGGEHSSDLWVVSMVLAGVAIALALSSPFVRRVFRPLVEPRASWLFRPRTEPER